MSVAHVMIDLETMDTAPTAAVVAIGTVKFDPRLPRELCVEDEFYVNVDLADAMAAGGTASAATIMWWLCQPAEARGRLTDPRPSGLLDALTGFSKWLWPLGPVCVWGNGADFDNVVLRGAYERVGAEAPWSFRANRCLRTLRAMAPGVTLEVPGLVAHYALDDARYQAMLVSEIYAELGL